MRASRRSDPVNWIARALGLSLLLLPVACAAPQKTATKGLVRDGTPDGVNVALARERGRARAFEWADFTPETFERARREGKPILLDGSAEWCHWCHVMDATTYTDPEIGRILREKFIAIRVDVDERPDLAERYGAWGWPATILFSPTAEEIGKYRGYIPANDLRGILDKVLGTGASPDKSPTGAGDKAPPLAAMPWIAGRVTVDLDGYYDPEQGGWGRRQKAPMGANILFELLRAAHGDASALARATFSLQQQRALIDPVWGGIYQYSAASTWKEPHFEKLMTYQAENLTACARAFARTKDPSFRRDAEQIAGYMTAFLTSADGAFLPSQDADVGGHDTGARFIDGHVYYALGDKERRAIGIPRVDPHVYPLENGLAIAAFVALHEATGDAAVLEKARRAADFVLGHLVSEDGSVRRAESASAVRYLADAASFGRALLVLGKATKEARYTEAAKKIGPALLRDFSGEGSAALFDHSPDAKAAGVFARRERSLGPNVLAARFFVALSDATIDPESRERARAILAAASTPRALDAQGRMLGEYLIALDEAGLYPW